MYYVLQENAMISLPTFSGIFLLIHYAASYLEKKERDQQKKHEKLKEKMKDTKRQLISHMDPVMIQAVKEIVKNDMRKEIEQLKNSDQGCSQKCILTNEMLRKDLDRNKAVVEQMISFKWCETCMNYKQPGAVSVCQAGCGSKLYGRCLPLMKEYGEIERDIQRLKERIQEITIHSQKFQDYQKAKRELEYEEVNRKSMTYSKIDKNFLEAQSQARMVRET